MKRIIRHTMEETRQAMVIAWTIRKKVAKEMNCRVGEVLFGECLKMAYAELKNNWYIDIDVYLYDMSLNKRTYDHILKQQSILAKNGVDSMRNSKPQQHWEYETTTSMYQFEFMPDELEDIRQSALLAILRKFSRMPNNVIKYNSRKKLFKMAVFNSAKAYIRNKRKFKLVPEDISEIGTILNTSKRNNDYNYMLTDMALKEGLDFTDYTICKMREENFQQQEIARKLGVSRQAIYKREKQLPAKVAGILS